MNITLEIENNKDLNDSKINNETNIINKYIGIINDKENKKDILDLIIPNQNSTSIISSKNNFQNQISIIKPDNIKQFYQDEYFFNILHTEKNSKLYGKPEVKINDFIGMGNIYFSKKKEMNINFNNFILKKNEDNKNSKFHYSYFFNQSYNMDFLIQSIRELSNQNLTYVGPKYSGKTFFINFCIFYILKSLYLPHLYINLDVINQLNDNQIKIYILLELTFLFYSFSKYVEFVDKNIQFFKVFEFNNGNFENIFHIFKLYTEFISMENNSQKRIYLIIDNIKNKHQLELTTSLKKKINEFTLILIKVADVLLYNNIEITNNYDNNISLSKINLNDDEYFKQSKNEHYIFKEEKFLYDTCFCGYNSINKKLEIDIDFYKTFYPLLPYLSKIVEKKNNNTLKYYFIKKKTIILNQISKYYDNFKSLEVIESQMYFYLRNVLNYNDKWITPKHEEFNFINKILINRIPLNFIGFYRKYFQFQYTNQCIIKIKCINNIVYKVIKNYCLSYEYNFSFSTIKFNSLYLKPYIYGGIFEDKFIFSLKSNEINLEIKFNDKYILINTFLYSNKEKNSDCFIKKENNRIKKYKTKLENLNYIENKQPFLILIKKHNNKHVDLGAVIFENNNTFLILFQVSISKSTKSIQKLINQLKVNSVFIKERLKKIGLLIDKMFFYYIFASQNDYPNTKTDFNLCKKHNINYCIYQHKENVLIDKNQKIINNFKLNDKNSIGNEITFNNEKSDIKNFEDEGKNEKYVNFYRKNQKNYNYYFNRKLNIEFSFIQIKSKFIEQMMIYDSKYDKN